MATDAQTSPEGEWIPRYFSDFRKEFGAFKEENARQHADLGGRISKVEGELRVIKASRSRSSSRWQPPPSNTS
ncbi:MAG: hypothetical protein OXL97_09175 [Chloroflexota bacterium]|nr:hypothetical protein [Chloroflexota bacterium]MDE2885000.1 hypothetical protein [Chloroflexota bacterium]